MTEDYRIESDCLGEAKVQKNALYGINTVRAIDNFQISEETISYQPNLLKAYALVKKSCAQANLECCILTKEKCDAISQACDEIYDLKYNKEFPICMIQGGAGTSTNMNFNEVIANRGLQIMGYKAGEYKYLSPYDDVNLCQSTNDTYPTSIKLAIFLENQSLEKELQNLINALEIKGNEFKDIIKIGRTQLQDAVPMTLGQTFHAYKSSIKAGFESLKKNSLSLLTMSLGGTAIGTGICSVIQFKKTVEQKMKDNIEKVLSKEIANYVKVDDDLIYAISDTSSFVNYSSELKCLSLKIIKICNDLRLLSSGPMCGLGEINLPKLQPGSSIMPGKVNPVMPEVIDQICYKVIGNDLTVSLSSENGQLELNAFEPVIFQSIMESIKWLSKGLNLFVNKCINNITANTDKCKELVYKSSALVTAFNPYLGYKKSTEILKEANSRKVSIVDIILEQKLLSKEQIELILKPENLVNPVKLDIKPIHL